VLTGFLFRPTGAGPFPAIVALHGCSGPGAASRELSKRHADWAERLVRAGYVVLMPDSFGSRGAKSLCGTRDRVVRPAERADDARGAAAWLAARPFVERGRIGALGWSNGGSTVLHLVAREGVGAAFAAAVAFYPGCRVPLKQAGWSARIPLLIQHGDADDWTPIAPCRQLAGSSKVRLIAYPGAFHDFDAPDMKLHVRRGTAYSANGTGVVHMGTHEPSRRAAIDSTLGYFAEQLRGSKNTP
jgi:dienelactone hydrolase